MESINKNYFRKWSQHLCGIPKQLNPRELSVANRVLYMCNCSLMITYHKARDNWAKVASCLLSCTKKKKKSRIEQIRREKTQTEKPISQLEGNFKEK